MGDTDAQAGWIMQGGNATVQLYSDFAQKAYARGIAPSSILGSNLINSDHQDPRNESALMSVIDSTRPEVDPTDQPFTVRQDIMTSVLQDVEKPKEPKEYTSLAAGSSGTGRASRAYEAWCNTNELHGSGGSTHGTTGAVTDGTQRVLTEALLKSNLKSCFDQGGNPDLLLVGSFNKQKVSGFTGNSTRMDMAEDRSLVATIDVYVSDFGEVRVVADRILRSSGRTALVVDTEMWSVAYLRPFGVQDLAKTGDAEKKQLLVEYTLVSKNEAASGKIADLTTS